MLRTCSPRVGRSPVARPVLVGGALGFVSYRELNGGTIMYFEGLDLEEHARRLKPIAASILGCDDQACDAVQEALVSLWKEPVKPANPWAWLVRTVVFRSKHALRCRLRRRKREELVGGRRAEQVVADPARPLEDAELGAAIERALAVLSDELRDAFLLREVGGLDYDSIAAHMSVPIGTVRSRIHRAKSQLQELLRSA